MLTMIVEPSRCVCGVDAARDFLNYYSPYSDNGDIVRRGVILKRIG